MLMCWLLRCQYWWVYIFCLGLFLFGGRCCGIVFVVCIGFSEVCLYFVCYLVTFCIVFLCPLSILCGIFQQIPTPIVCRFVVGRLTQLVVCGVILGWCQGGPCSCGVGVCCLFSWWYSLWLIFLPLCWGRSSVYFLLFGRGWFVVLGSSPLGMLQRACCRCWHRSVFSRSIVVCVH